jgi:hypothetical protein
MSSFDISKLASSQQPTLVSLNILEKLGIQQKPSAPAPQFKFGLSNTEGQSGFFNKSIENNIKHYKPAGGTTVFVHVDSNAWPGTNLFETGKPATKALAAAVKYANEKQTKVFIDADAHVYTGLLKDGVVYVHSQFKYTDNGKLERVDNRARFDKPRS